MLSLTLLEKVLAWYASGHELVCDLHSYLAGISTCESYLCRNRCSPLSAYPTQYPGSRVIHCNAYTSQAARDVRASQDTLVDIFERIEFFFRRLVIHIRVQPTPEMMYIIVKIMVEVLSILGIATKEINEGRTSQ